MHTDTYTQRQADDFLAGKEAIMEYLELTPYEYGLIMMNTGEYFAYIHAGAFKNYKDVLISGSLRKIYWAFWKYEFYRHDREFWELHKTQRKAFSRRDYLDAKYDLSKIPIVHHALQNKIRYSKEE